LIATAVLEGLAPMKLFARVLFVCSLLLASQFFTGCASAPTDPIFISTPQQPDMNSGVPGFNDSSKAATNANSTVARFRVGDTVVVQLSGLPEDVLPHEESIKEDGRITMPLIGPVRAAGKTAGELQNDILALYVPKYYQRLTVTVKSSQDRVYYVGGEVKQPGRQLYVGTTTVTKAIQSAGDFSDFAKKTKVILIRANGERIEVNCEKAISDPSQDPIVYPGDQIQVPRRYW
jgi:protein involved in polysaccharide export with SLBB domain